MAFPECAYAAGPGAGLELTWSGEQEPKLKSIINTHGIFHQKREKCVSYVAHSKDLVRSEGVFILFALQSLLCLHAWLLLVIVLGQ